jgi:uncharacterized protein YegL
MRRNAALALALLLGLPACTEAKLRKTPEAPPTPIDDKLSVQGKVCTTDPSTLTFPVKIILVVDSSQSMNVSDPIDPVTLHTGRRDAAEEVVNTLLAEDKEGVGIAIITFAGAAVILTSCDYLVDDGTGTGTMEDCDVNFDPTDPDSVDGPLPNCDGIADTDCFSNNRAELLLGATPQLDNGGGLTAYFSALGEAFTLLSADVQNVDEISLARSKYVVVFLSDGLPDSDLAEERENIMGAVEDMVELAQAARVGEFSFNTAFLSTAATPQIAQAAEDLLRGMADVGNGTFRSFPNGEAINFLDVDLTSLRRAFTLSTIIAVNSNTLIRDTDILVDSDGDTLADSEEDLDMDGNVDLNEDRDANGVLGEDVDEDGHLDVNEDTNGNGILDLGEDPDCDGQLQRADDLDGDGVLLPSEDRDCDSMLDVAEDTDGNGLLTGFCEDRDGNDQLDAACEDTNRDGRLDASEDVDDNGILDRGDDQNCNGVLDTCEDKNFNGVFDPTEDANGNGVLDGTCEDKNSNGIIDPGEDANANGVLDRNEDTNCNDRLDLAEVDTNGDGAANACEDLDCDGHLDLGETDPTNIDTDGYGFNDALEVDLCPQWRTEPDCGFTPLDAANLPPPPATPQPEDCVLDLDKLDVDGDGFRDCEERFYGTTRLSYDSDRDGLPDQVEVRFGTNPSDDDAEDDADFDKTTNGQEVRTFGDPRNNDAATRAQRGYRYRVLSDRLEGPVSCREFRVENITLVDTRDDGWNLIYVYAGQVPFDDPGSAVDYRVACAWARFDEDNNLKDPPGGFLELTEEDFHPPVCTDISVDDCAPLDITTDCVGPRSL